MTGFARFWRRFLIWGRPCALQRPARAGLALAAALLLAACQQDLYSNLSEVEANQMLAVLIANGVQAEKVARGKEGFSVAVDTGAMVRAIALLNDAGFPRNSRESIGKVFQKTGIMSSPFEERVRYIYALGEEVGATLGQIDGVVSARVHIVLPEAPQMGQPVKPSSAAVFIRHQPGVDLDFFAPQIRRLVSSAIEGLDPTQVTVVMTEARPTKTLAVNQGQATTEVVPGLLLRDVDLPRFWRYVWAIAGLVLLLLAGLAGLVLLLLRQRKAAGSRPSGRDSASQVEPT